MRYVQLFSLEEEVGPKTREYLLEKTAAKLQASIKATEKLKLIDHIQRLGISYYFEDIIHGILQLECAAFSAEEDLFTTALRFRLLRDAGFHVSTGTPPLNTRSYTIYIMMISPPLN